MGRFRNVLRRNPHQHPLLYLKGVKYKELTSVLNFMYQGEVNVAQDELNSFLAVAEELKVKGDYTRTQINGEKTWVLVA
jgi:BTB/POZ domain